MKRSRLLVALAALALILAACTSDDGDTDTTEAAATTEAATETTEASTDTTEAMTDTTEATEGGDGESDSLLDEVTARGELNCGTRDAFPGFAVLTEDGDHVGFDSDFCRVIAAAVLGDAEAVNHVDLETADRFTALQSGQVDVLVRNTTHTAGRDGGEGATFLTVNYYDGQGMMVNTGDYTSVTEMDGVVVCSAGGTTTEGDAATEATRLGLDWEIRSFPDTDLLQEAFIAGQCDGWTSDFSQLTGLRSVYPDGPDALTILPEVFSKQPLAPAVLDGDTAWAQAVDWAVMATIQAEEFGITSENVDDFLTSDNPSILQFLGQEFDDGEGNVATFDPGLGLPVDFAYQVISQVGNYGEIFDEHLTPLGLERGVNALWTDGGLMYAIPYR
jgi:general L-amino acid transport system substrate-binding protein